MRPGIAVVLGILLLPAARAAAQPSVPLPAPDFMLGSPRGSVTIRGGWTFLRGSSDWYDFVTRTLTLENKDFNLPAIGGDIGIALSRRIEVVGSVDFGSASALSEYRDFVDNLRLPIEQTTTLRQTNVAGGVKVYLMDRGRSIGRLAFVPRTVVPYVGGGAGALWYYMRQTGSFVDYVDFSVFPDTFLSSGVTPSAHVYGGADLRVWRRLYVTLEARHRWAAGDLGRDWIDFEPMDLTGTRVSGGINVVF